MKKVKTAGYWLCGIVILVSALYWGGRAMFMTDAKFGRMMNLGKPAKIICYSGGNKMIETFSTGKVESIQDSDGYYWKDYKTKRNRESNMDCELDYGAPRPEEK